VQEILKICTPDHIEIQLAPVCAPVGMIPRCSAHLVILLEVGYYGSEGHHLIGIVDINQPAPGAYLAAGLPTPTDNYSGAAGEICAAAYRIRGAINVAATAFSSNYHSLQASLQKPLKGGSLRNFNYTWSHALTNAQSDFATPQDNTNIRGDYGPAVFDRRHIFNANFVWIIPWLKTQNGWIGHAFGGWELSGIVTFESGLPLTVTGVSSDPAGLGLLDPNTNALARPDQVSDANSGAPHSAQQWFNTAAFVDVDPTVIRAGNAPPGSIKGPGLQRWDLSIFKNAKLTERVAMQFRVEAFNVFNHTNFDQIDTSLFDDTFGQVLSTHNPRQMQLGVKLTF